MKFRIVGNCDEATAAIYMEKNLKVDHADLGLFDRQAILKTVKGYDCWLNFGHICDGKMLEELSDHLQMICRNGIGYDQIDIDTATKLGICVTNTAGSMNQSVGETAVILILETLRKTYLSHRKLVQGIWERGLMTSGLDGKTVGFIGFGGIGRQCAKYLNGFDCKKIIFDEYISDELADQFGAERVSLDELAARSDVITIHCPLMESTRGMINMDFFQKMKPSGIIVNTARGPIINEKDLIEALDKGVIGGAGLDVFEEEPIRPENPLLKMENVFALPHISANTRESAILTRKIGAANIVDFLEGRIPRNCVNPDYIKFKRR